MLSLGQLIVGGERPISIQHEEEFRRDSGRCPLEVKFLSNSESIHECAKALKGGR